MIRLRSGSKPGTGVISSIIGLLFVVTFLVSAASLTKIVLAEQRLDAVAADSVRRLTVGEAFADATYQSGVEHQIEEMFPSYKKNMSFSLQREGSLLTLQISVSDISVSIWPGISAGPYTITASATSYIES